MRKFFRRFFNRTHKPEATVAIYVHGNIYQKRGASIWVTTPDNNTFIVGDKHVAPNGVSIANISLCLAMADKAIAGWAGALPVLVSSNGR